MKKDFGQNFLIDENIAKKEINYANISKNDIILEIGPGYGILTKLLAEKAKKVIAVEIDKKLADILKEKVPSNVAIINNDVLKLDFDKLPKFNKIVSNLPFQISSPITFKILEYNFSLAILIYQKEFAERMIAKKASKNYSRLSVGVYYKSHCEKLDFVSKNCFKPKPKVDSCIVRLMPRKKPPFSLKDEKFFYDFTKLLFNHRRKKIKTTLCTKYEISNLKHEFLEKRVEELTPEQIGELSNMFFDKVER